MKVVFIRAKRFSEQDLRDSKPDAAQKGAVLENMRINAKTSSSSKNMIQGLYQAQYVSHCEEWRFWPYEYHEIHDPGQMPVKLFPCDENFALPEVQQYLEDAGEPDIIWIEATTFPLHIRRVFEFCPHSFKMIYSKDWRPWKIENLGAYDLCVVDDEWEAARVKKRHPGVHSFVWDKTVDYETLHRPLPLPKKYDICYVAHYRERKNHALLFRAMAQIADQKLTAICIGGNRKGHMAELQQMANGYGLTVHFTDEVTHEEVNYYINQSRIGVMCSKYDAAPRAILEYMAADVPVLVNAELLAGCRYVSPLAGVIRPPEDFHKGILELLDNYHRFSPRKHLIENYSREKVVSRFIQALETTPEFLNQKQTVAIRPL